MSETKSTHSWELTVHYHRCPSCGYIIESRKDYEYRLGEYVKDLECGRCGHPFTVKKYSKPAFGPLFGKEQPAEIDWS